MESQKLESQNRDLRGKGAARKLRGEGRVPAVVYGHHEETLSISVSEREFRRILIGNWETAIVDLTIPGAENKDVIIKNIQQHPATGRILHVDFQHIRRGEKLRLTVPVELTGDPRGVKEMGGILEHGAREVSVRCMPRDIPDHIEIDVSALDIQDAVHVRDIVERYPDLEFLDDDELTLAIVVPPKLEVEKDEEEALEEGEEEPEVIAKGKEEKEGAEESD